MTKIVEYLSKPETLIALWVFLFSLGWAYASLNSRINAIEKAQAELNASEIQTTLAQIQTDIQWIKLSLEKK